MTFAPFVILGNPVFDYFFSVGFVFVMISIGSALVFKLLKW